MTFEQLLAQYSDPATQDAMRAGWNAANTAALNALLDRASDAFDAGHGDTGRHLLALADDLIKDTLTMKVPA
jgi:hypothetical protein